MDEEMDQNVGNVHLRDEDDNNNNRNVRQNIGRNNDLPRQEPFATPVPLAIGNIQIIKSQSGRALCRTPLNPRSRVLPLANLISNGSEHGTVCIFYIMSISLSSGQTYIQQQNNGARGQIQNQRHHRRLTLMCPLSPAGSNTAMILHGNGNCPRLFDSDLSLRDGGAIRKFYSFINKSYRYAYLLTFNFFISLYNRSRCHDSYRKSSEYR